VLAAGVVRPGVLPEQRADAFKGQFDESATRYSSWSPIFRVDVVDIGPDLRLLYHDGLVGSVIHRWDGKQASLGRFGFDTDPRALPFAVGGTSPDNVLIVGAAGGHEILSSLYFNARHIDAVELNPVTHSLVTDKFAGYAGHLAENPAVNYVQGDGRSFLARSDDTYNVVWYPAPDSYAATNAATAGAFVLSESYLYTSETIKDSLDHLGGNGILAAQFGEFDYEHKPNRTSRYAATARHALGELGVRDPARHILVATSPVEGGASLSTILVKREPFTTAEVDRFLAALGTMPGGTLRYAPGHPVRGESVSAIATLPGSRLDRWSTRIPTTSGRSPTTHRSSGTSPRSATSSLTSGSRSTGATSRSTSANGCCCSSSASRRCSPPSSSCCPSSASGASGRGFHGSDARRFISPRSGWASCSSRSR
jgi:hypothetical protein